ncbi:MAG TPA: hypothetical protein VMH39_17600 [Gemmatimonadaceae bacterium]|nr:hypothetical protein [Gemmatimonadaceae bacterium]
MIIATYEGRRLGRSATIVAAVALVGAGALILAFGMVLLVAMLAAGVGLGCAAFVARRFRRGELRSMSKAESVALDPALEVTPRIGPVDLAAREPSPPTG